MPKNEQDNAFLYACYAWVVGLGVFYYMYSTAQGKSGSERAKAFKDSWNVFWLSWVILCVGWWYAYYVVK